MMKPTTSRLVFIDVIRAFAICMMLEGHFIDGLLAPEYRDENNLLFATWLYIRGMTAPVFFTVSEFSKKELSTYLGIPLERIHVTYNGVEHIKKNISEMVGLGRRMPITMSAFSLASLGIAGFPFFILMSCVRLHLAFASGFLSVCEGKGLYVRRACQYVILRISSRPCTWPECSFYRRPIYCLSAPYTSHGVPEIHEP